MGRDVRSLSWYERWGDFLTELHTAGLTQRDAALAARKASSLLDRVRAYGSQGVSRGATRALEAAIEDIADGSFPAWRAKRTQERRLAQERAANAMLLRSQEWEAFRALEEMALASQDGA